MFSKIANILVGATVLFSINLWAVDGSGPGGRFDFRKKAESKTGSRWTLQEWLEQKERNRLMDLWLAMYAPSPYEFFISGIYNNPSSGQSTQGLELGAYATIIGIQGHYEKNNESNTTDTSGSLNIRLLGNAVQGTHLIAGYGLRTRVIDSGSVTQISQHFWNLDLNLYLNKHFGILGKYQSFFPTSGGGFDEITAQNSEYGLFIDFSFIRVSGSSYTHRQTTSTSGSETNETQEGSRIGLTFFF